MTWAVIILLAVAVFGLAIFVFRVPAGPREALAAALLFGIAGYAMQGSPFQPAAPKAAGADPADESAFLVDARSQISNSTIPPTNRWVIIADGLSRNGQNAEAAQILRSAVKEDPKNSEAWLSMANALLAHADGTLTPAASYAYHRAAAADEKAPGPPFFLGLALAQSGQFAQARDMWADLLLHSKPDARWRPVVAAELVRLDAFIKAASGAGEHSPVAQPRASAPDASATVPSESSPDGTGQ